MDFPPPGCRQLCLPVPTANRLWLANGPILNDVLWHGRHSQTDLGQSCRFLTITGRSTNGNHRVAPPAHPIARRTPSSPRPDLICGRDCSVARSSTPSPTPASSWKAGGASTIGFDHMDRWATDPQPRRSSFRSPRGRLRYPDRLRRPRWRPRQTCTNIQTGPLVGG